MNEARNALEQLAEAAKHALHKAGPIWEDGPALAAIDALRDAALAGLPAVEASRDYSEMSREQLERHTARMSQALADDRSRAFYDKHALGPMMAPSCLCCGRLPEKVAIQHLDLPGIVICEACRDAAAPVAVLAAEPEDEFVAFEAHWGRPGYAIDLTRKHRFDSSGCYVNRMTNAMFSSWLAARKTFAPPATSPVGAEPQEQSTFPCGLIKCAEPTTALRYLAKRLRADGIDSAVADDFAEAIEFLLSRRDDLAPAPAVVATEPFVYSDVKEIIDAHRNGNLLLQTSSGMHTAPRKVTSVQWSAHRSCVFVDTEVTRGMSYKFWADGRAEREDIKLVTLATPSQPSPAPAVVATEPKPEFCPHAAPFVYCQQCAVDPCPLGLGVKK